MLAFIVIACHLNVSSLTTPDANTPGCKEYVQDLSYTEVPLTPMTCIMNSVPMIAKFEEEHPGWQPRKWTCKMVAPSQDI